MASVDPDDVGRRPLLRTRRAIEVELSLEHLVRKEWRHGDAPAALGGEGVRAIGGASEVDPVRLAHEGDDVRVVDVEVLTVVREALVVERREQQIDRLLVTWSRVFVEWDAGLRRDPAVTAPDTPLVPPAGEDVRRVDHA